MRIGLFLASAGSSSGGPERYEVELVRGLAARDTRNEYRLFCLFRGGPERIGVDAPNVRYEVLSPQVRVVSMLSSLPWKLWRRDLDVVHATFVPPPLTPRDYMFTLVCSSMFEHPEFYPPAIRARLLFLFGRAVRKAALILCISEHIRDYVRERFAIAEERLAVVYLGVNPAFRPIDDGECRRFLSDRYGIDQPYFLFSGRWEPRKNIARILEAFALYKRDSRSPLKMVFTGEHTWAAEEAEAVIAREGLGAEIIDLGKSPVDELPYLYAGAQALVYPSLWEGFGLPIVEAMAAGTPVITSNNSSMAEIGGDAALLVEPRSVEQIAEAMQRSVSDRRLRARLREKGLQRARRFSWERTAAETLAAYEQMAAVRS